jgi:hypothetical protein
MHPLIGNGLNGVLFIRRGQRVSSVGLAGKPFVANDSGCEAAA